MKEKSTMLWESTYQDTWLSQKVFRKALSTGESVKLPPGRWQEVERQKWTAFGGSKKGHWEFKDRKEAWLKPKENGELGDGSSKA